MLKKIIFLFLLIFCSSKVFAYEDCMIITNGKLNQIKIENNQIIDVFPLITVMNEKNTLIVHPLKEGLTGFTVVKNDKDKFLFMVKVTEDETKISEKDGFNIIAIDEPPSVLDYDLDLPYWGQVEKKDSGEI